MRQQGLERAAACSLERTADGCLRVRVPRVEGLAHGVDWYTNTLRVERDTTFPLTILVEEGKHASVPDRNADGVYTPGYDVNVRVIAAVHDEAGTHIAVPVEWVRGSSVRQSGNRARLPSYTASGMPGRTRTGGAPGIQRLGAPRLQSRANQLHEPQGDGGAGDGAVIPLGAAEVDGRTDGDRACGPAAGLPSMYQCSAGSSHGEQIMDSGTSKSSSYLEQVAGPGLRPSTRLLPGVPDRAYTVTMHSRLAHQLRREQAARHATMTPAERVALAMRLGEAHVVSYMTMHSLDRQAALSRIKAARQAGRRRSVCAEPDADQ